MRANPLLFVILAAAAIYVITLRRQLEAARMRGDMYREIANRLDKRVNELSAGSE